MAVDLHRREETPLFPTLTDAEIEALKTLMEFKPIFKGQMICKEQEIAHTMFFIEKGEVEFYTIKGKNKIRPVRTLKAGKFFGEGAVLREDHARSLYARAKTDVWVWELHREKFAEVVHKHPDIALYMMREMAQWLTTLVPSSIATQLERERSDVETMIVKLVRTIGSIPFVAVNTVLAVGWAVFNKLHPEVIDKPELPVLAVILAFEAILVTVLVLAKQNADEEDANRRTQAILDYTEGTEREVKTLRASVNGLKETVASLQASMQEKR